MNRSLFLKAPALCLGLTACLWLIACEEGDKDKTGTNNLQGDVAVDAGDNGQTVNDTGTNNNGPGDTGTNNNGPSDTGTGNNSSSDTGNNNNGPDDTGTDTGNNQPDTVDNNNNTGDNEQGCLGWPVCPGHPLILKGAGSFPQEVGEAIVYLNSIKVVEEHHPYRVILNETNLRQPIDLKCLEGGWTSILALIPRTTRDSVLVTISFSNPGLVAYASQQNICYACNNDMTNSVDMPFRIRSLHGGKTVVELDLRHTIRTAPNEVLSNECPFGHVTFAPKGKLY